MKFPDFLKFGNELRKFEPLNWLKKILCRSEMAKYLNCRCVHSQWTRWHSAFCFSFNIIDKCPFHGLFSAMVFHIFVFFVGNFAFFGRGRGHGILLFKMSLKCSADKLLIFLSRRRLWCLLWRKYVYQISFIWYDSQYCWLRVQC